LPAPGEKPEVDHQPCDWESNCPRTVTERYMLNTKESIDFFKGLQKSLSLKRFDGYSGKGSHLDALAKYIWNVHLCESLYPCFQLLEVAFRNRVHTEVAYAIKVSDWIFKELPILYEEERDAIGKAKDELTKAKSPITEDYLVSEMKFGFWTSLLNSRYDRLWHKIIAGVLPNMPKTSRTRADVSVLMNSVRRLRNAALHHHSIWHWGDLKNRHDQMRLLISYICAPSAAIADNIDRFSFVHSTGMSECQKIASKILKSISKPANPTA
jgi:hypothetical protein